MANMSSMERWLTLVGLPDATGHNVRYAVKVPWVLGLIATIIGALAGGALMTVMSVTFTR